MGKKDKNKKKGKGAEKTAVKTEKKLTQKMKKELVLKGEEDIEKIVAQIEIEEQKRQMVAEHLVEPPSRRVNFTLTPHPEKEELILFGGEFYNGQKTMVYNDLFLYNIARNEWTAVKAPGGPPPRCAHQAVTVAGNKGQLWVFGGEFTSPTESQFYHYRDLWVYHLGNKKWEKVHVPGGPSARSGHRMVVMKKQLIVFGGFHDNLRDYKYFNDVYIFSLESYTWKKIEPSGTAPSPRSGCLMIALPDGKILISGGYSKERVKKDDVGTIHSDMFLLSPDKNDTTGLKWKWVSAKPSGVRMTPRSGMSLTIAGNKAYAFGGVFDIEEEEDEMTSHFLNDFYILDLDKIVWRTVTLSGKRELSKIKKRRRKGRDVSDDQEMMDENSEGEEEEQHTECTKAEADSTVIDDGTFRVTISQATSSQPTTAVESGTSSVTIFMPPPRSNCGMAVIHGTLYLYGGLLEIGERQYTLADMYSLDLHKLEEWKTIISDDVAKQEWLESENSSDSSGSESEEDEDEMEEGSENAMDTD